METEAYELDLGCDMPTFDEEYWRSLLDGPYEHEEAPEYAWVIDDEDLIPQRRPLAKI